jgi:hypothetical protein
MNKKIFAKYFSIFDSIKPNHSKVNFIFYMKTD